MPDPAVDKLEAQLLGALDELDRLNADAPRGQIATAADLCGQECRIWYLQESIALRKGDTKTALACHRAAMEAEQRRLAAHKERNGDLLPKIIERLDAQDRKAEALHVIPDGDIPDFNPDNESLEW